MEDYPMYYEKNNLNISEINQLLTGIDSEYRIEEIENEIVMVKTHTCKQVQPNLLAHIKKE